MARVLVGCSGWQYNDWREVLYPKGCAQRDWLSVYAAQFPTVEVNSTFYRLPKREPVARWVQQVPDDFVFAVKVSRYITHIKRLTTVADGMERLLERIEPLITADRLGPLLWQLPPNFQRDDERLAGALAELPPGLRHAFEFRHSSWFHDDVYARLREHDVAAVLAHDARRDLPHPPPTADFAFVRFHWGARGRRGNYSDAELRDWVEPLEELAAGREVFVYFNNDWEGFAIRNAVTLTRLLES
jgi:uncharacterized protein YecE (DUF72 family)